MVTQREGVCEKCGSTEIYLVENEYEISEVCGNCWNEVILEVKKERNIPKCPTCQSTNIENISGTQRFITTGLFGLASSDVGKTMHCKNCGYKW